MLEYAGHEASMSYFEFEVMPVISLVTWLPSKLFYFTGCV